MLLSITPQIHIAEEEVDFTAIRAQGAGGQNVNKVSSAVHLRFDIQASSLPEWVKSRLLQLHDKRISHDGIIHIKAQTYRTQARNRDDAMMRLMELLQHVTRTVKVRKPTHPGRQAKERRLHEKATRSAIKVLRRKKYDE